MKNRSVRPPSQPSHLNALDQVQGTRYRRWMLVHIAALVLATPILIGLVTALAWAGTSPVTAIILGFFLSGLLLTLLTLTSWLQSHHWLDSLFRRIRARANIGAERLARDDEKMVVEGVTDVVFEWRHFDILLRERDWVAILLAITMVAGFVLQLVVSSGLPALVTNPLDMSPDLDFWITLAGIALSGLASLSGLCLARSVYNSECFRSNEFDPTDMIQARLLNLLEEVKMLRRSRVLP